ncbi:hypothetical protein AAMO2058_001586900 [Amorphochlora amoebiformis]
MTVRWKGGGWIWGLLGIILVIYGRYWGGKRRVVGKVGTRGYLRRDTSRKQSTYHLRLTKLNSSGFEGEVYQDLNFTYNGWSSRDTSDETDEDNISLIKSSVKEADNGEERVSGGEVFTLAGDHLAPPCLVDGFGTKAAFNNPRGISLWEGEGGDVSVFVADTRNNAIRKISPHLLVETIAGRLTVGLQDGTGSNAEFGRPEAVLALSKRTLVVADTENNCLRYIRIGTPPPVATTTNVQCMIRKDRSKDATRKAIFVERPIAMSMSPDASILLAGGNHIRKISPDTKISKIQLNGPQSIAVDPSGSLYVTDHFGGHTESTHTIVKLDSNGNPFTFAGCGFPGYRDGFGLNARFHTPVGISIDANANIFVADTLNLKIRKLS